MISAVIPVRKGSRRLPNKNLSDFNGVPLLVHKIRQLKKVPQISSIYVSSDSDEMLDLADAEGALIHKRAERYCDEATEPFGKVVSHICESIKGDHIIWACCTSPLVNEDEYSSAIQKYFECLSLGYDSLMTVELFQRYLWTEHGPLNYELGVNHVPSQELPKIYRVTDGIQIAPRLDMIKWCYFHGNKPYRLFLEKKSCIDIDDALDLACAVSWSNVKE